MGLFRSLSGMLKLEITSADPALTITRLNEAGVELFNTSQTGDLTIRFSLRRRDYPRVRALCEKRGEQVKVVERSGFFWQLYALRKRPVLVGGIAFLLACALYLPSRVLFIRVEGNELVPTRLILEGAEQVGIGFGASRREVRSENVKNALLEAIPTLQWAGINTNGCVATISVRERTQTEQQQKTGGVSSIVAARDGVIRQATVLRGNGVCKVGQAVKSGEVLISGYTDCGLSIQATRAEGEIFAQTERALTVVTPDEYSARGGSEKTETKYALRIGKKRINFYKNSGIPDATCGRMYTEYVLTLPGGFPLPVTLIVEEYDHFEPVATTAVQADTAQVLSEYAQYYLKTQMVAGQILNEHTIQEQNRLYGQYACLEMIGRERSEEIVEHNGKTD